MNTGFTVAIILALMAIGLKFGVITIHGYTYDQIYAMSQERCPK